MTNGEKIKAMFPSMIIGFITESQIGIYFVKNQNSAVVFSLDWWNAEYKEPNIRNCFGCRYSKDNHNAGTEECHLCMWENQYTPTTKKVDCIDRTELLKAIDTWDKFGCDADTKLVPYQDHYIPYIHYDDVIKCIKSMPSVTPQQSWIPVSERLPESDEEYHTFLVTDNKGRVTLSEFYLSISDRKPYWSGMIDVIAWMLLPQPYREVKE